MPTTTPSIAEILTLLPSDVRAVRVFEILTIYWQGGIRTRHYSDGRWVEDFPALTTFGFDVIEARFARNDWFVELPRTTEISDDTVKLKMWDADAVLISEFLNSGEGTRVRVAQYFPDYNLVNEIWWGFLKQPNETEGLWFSIDAASGLRSPNLIVPRRAIYPGCQAIFGGLLNPDTGLPYFDTAAKIAENDCPYDRHIGGSYGTLQGSSDPNPGQPWTTCPRRVPDDCKKRLGLETGTGGYSGYHLSYMAFDVVLESVGVGLNKTLLPVYANDNVLSKPLRVVYGQRWVRDLVLLAYVAESYGDHPANGFLRTLWAICEGPIVGTPEFWSGGSGATDPNAWSGIVVNGQYVTHSNGGDTWGIGGNPRQHPTSFSPNVLNYPNTSIAHVDYGRADFRNFNPDGFEGACQIQGKKNVRIYSDATTFTKAYTTNRAWCLLDLYTSRRYGLGLDVTRFVIQDWIDLAAYCDEFVSSINETGATVSIPRTTFNADITEGKWSDHLQDICLAGMFTLPYYHQGHLRIEPLEVGVPSSPPIFSDQGTDGTTRNIVFSNNQSTLKYSRESDSKIPNQIKVNFDDVQYQNQSRPLVLNDDVQQMKAGVAAGDQSSRPVTKEYNAVGTDNMAEAYRMAKRILDLGPFEQGGVVNNFKIKFTTWSLLSDVLGLHPYSIIRVVSQTVNRFQEAPGYPYEYFRIQKLTRKANLQMDIEAQIFPRQYIENNSSHPPAPAVQNDGGPLLGAPETPTFASLTASPGTLFFTLQIGGTAPDTTPPVITSVASSSVTSTDATITWTTDEPADSQVEYGTTTAYGSSTTLVSTLVTSHSQSISGLTASTTYHYRVKSRDASGNLATSADFTFATTSSTSTLLTGLVSYWKMDETSTSATRVDQMSTNPLTPYGAVGTPTGIIGNGASCTGSEFLYIGDNSSLAFSGSMSVAGWMNFPSGSISSGQHALLTKYYAGAIEWAVWYYAPSGDFQFIVSHDGSSTAYVNNNHPATASTWYFVAAVFDSAAGQIKLSINAGTPTTASFAGPLYHSSTAALGSMIMGAAYSVCSVDEIGLWNKALTSTEISTLYNGGAGKTYPF